MPVYMYKAMTKSGQIVKNRMTEVDKQACIQKLKQNDLMPIKITQTFGIGSFGAEQKKPRNFKKEETNIKEAEERIRRAKETEKSVLKQLVVRLENKHKISSRDIRIFTQNFYLLKKAKFNNVHALSTVMENTENPKLRAVIEDILYGVESGEFMYTTMEYYSDIFPYIYINIIKVGELSGSLDLALGQAIKYLDETEELNTKLRRILIPNLATFLGTILMLIVCMVVGLPAVQNIFTSVGTKDQLPAITLWFGGVVNTFLTYWYIPTFILVGIIAAIVVYIHTPIGRHRFDRFKYTMPIFGKLIYLIDFSRLLRNMLLNIQNGIRIQDALDVSKNVVKNTIMLEMVDEAINNIYVGKSWIEPFETVKFSNPMTVEMLNIGMKTDLVEMMEKLVEYMDIDIDNALERIMKILPEIAGAVVGAVLIFFVIVVLVPCIQIYMGGFLFSAYGY